MPSVIATSRQEYVGLAETLQTKTGHNFQLIELAQDLTFERLSEISPEYVFFPHWSTIIPASIYEHFQCVIFHMTDLPFGRGGSPLQNLIVRGYKETKVSALRCVKELDAGPIYLKRELSLEGTARDIFVRCSSVISDMIEEIVLNRPLPQEQIGEPVLFRRRRPDEGQIGQLRDLERVYDYIRMLDADGYPPAFVETDTLRIEFSKASINSDGVTANVRITLK